MRHVVMFSGGIGSWAAAKRVVALHGVADVTLLFTDTLMEDADLYRFLEEGARNVGAPLVRLVEGRTPWQVFRDERFLGNSRVDPCSKILKRQMADAWLAANCAIADTTVYVGIDWSERHRLVALQERRKPWRYEGPMCDAPYLSKPMMLDWLRSEGIAPPYLYRLGFSHNNCFSGDTRFITSEGVRTLGEMVNRKVTILGFSAGWHSATVESFGPQNLWKLTVRRYNDEKIIWTTSEHRWFRRRRPGRTSRIEIRTKDLQPGDCLTSMYGRLLDNVRPSAIGIAHGIVFGDGTHPRGGLSRNPARVLLCGDKDAQLLRFFPLSPSQEIPGVGIEVRDLPRHWKQLPPLDESQSYLYGWLIGYFAADGSASDGGITLSSATREHVDFVREVALRLGIATGPIRTEQRMGYGPELSALHMLTFVPDTLREDFFLIEEHRRRYTGTARNRPADWRVVSVEATNRVEEVFCAVVPDGHVFTLEDNILTGNCGGFCIKAGAGHFARLLATLPDRYADAEAKEEGMRAYLGRDDIAILRDRGDGRSRPMTLRELRGRLQAGGQADLFDEGGCGCFVDAEADR